MEQGTEWSLATKSELLELLSGVRKLPGISSGTLTEEAKAVLLVVIGYRKKGGVSRTVLARSRNSIPLPISRIYQTDLVYTAPREKNSSWWRPTPEALLAWVCAPPPISPNSRSSNATLIP